MHRRLLSSPKRILALVGTLSLASLGIFATATTALAWSAPTVTPACAISAATYSFTIGFPGETNAVLDWSWGSESISNGVAFNEPANGQSYTLTVPRVAGQSVLYVWYHADATAVNSATANGTLCPPPTCPACIAGTTAIMYDSIDPGDTWPYAQAFNGTEIQQFGNAVNLKYSGENLQSAVVGMTNFWIPAGSTVAQSFSTPITFNVYNTALGLLATDTQTFTIPAAVAGQGETPDGNETFTVTFDFATPVALPDSVIYGIALPTLNSDCSSTPSDCGNDPNPVGSLNVNLTIEPTEVSVGSDTNPGHVYVATTSANTAGPDGQISCTPVQNGFASYSTALGNGGNCGYNVATNTGAEFVPTVELIGVCPATATPTPTATATPTPTATPVAATTPSTGGGSPTGGLPFGFGLGLLAIAAGLGLLLFVRFSPLLRRSARTS